MNENVIKITFGSSRMVKIPSLMQWDIGQVLQFTELFPNGTEVQFSDGSVRLIEDSTAKIPDKLLQNVGEFKAWVQVIGSDSETTVKEIVFTVARRKKKNDYIEPKDEPSFREKLQNFMNTTKNALLGINSRVTALEKKNTYLSLERLGSYLYRVSFLNIPEDNGLDASIPSGCSSYVQDGKLYRNLDWDYSELASFNVRCSEFEGMAFSSGLTDSELDDATIGQLPHRLVDGGNNYGIRVSTHVLFNDWDWQGTGSTPLYKVPYLILSRVKTLDNFSSQIADILGDLYATPTLIASDYLLHFLVTDGTQTYCIMPPESSSGSYIVVDISENPKLSNFRWVSSATVTREDLQTRPTGVERWNAMPTSLENLRFTKAYESPDRLSEFIGLRGTTKDSTDSELESIYSSAHELYQNRTRNGMTWQTMHSVVYGATGLEALYVQENWSKNYIN